MILTIMERMASISPKMNILVNEHENDYEEGERS